MRRPTQEPTNGTKIAHDAYEQPLNAPPNVGAFYEPIGAELTAPPKTALQTAGVQTALRIKPIELKTKPSGHTSRELNWARLWLAACLLCAFGFLGQAAWKSTTASAKPSLAAANHAPAIRSIETITLGDNVLTQISDHVREKTVGNVNLLPAEDQLDAQIDLATSREVVLRAIDDDGSQHNIRLLKSVAWLEERAAQVGGQIHLELPEQGFVGQAGVLAINPCPAIKPGRGRTVTGVFVHTSANILDLHIDSLTEPLGVTANHPIYSVDRDDFIPAGQLQPGERLQKLDGTSASVVRIEPREKPETVYNIEVQGDHVYRVTTEGLLVHNSCYDNLVAAAKLKYPKLANVDHLHHTTPMYLGGPKYGPKVKINGAYHQEITNEFRARAPYGTGRGRSPQEIKEIMDAVYDKFPLPPQ